MYICTIQINTFNKSLLMRQFWRIFEQDIVLFYDPGYYFV